MSRNRLVYCLWPTVAAACACAAELIRRRCVNNTSKPHRATATRLPNPPSPQQRASATSNSQLHPARHWLKRNATIRPLHEACCPSAPCSCFCRRFAPCNFCEILAHNHISNFGILSDVFLVFRMPLIGLDSLLIPVALDIVAPGRAHKQGSLYFQTSRYPICYQRQLIVQMRLQQHFLSYQHSVTHSVRLHRLFALLWSPVCPLSARHTGPQSRFRSRTAASPTSRVTGPTGHASALQKLAEPVCWMRGLPSCVMLLMHASASPKIFLSDSNHL